MRFGDPPGRAVCLLHSYHSCQVLTNANMHDGDTSRRGMSEEDCAYRLHTAAAAPPPFRQLAIGFQHSRQELSLVVCLPAQAVPQRALQPCGPSATASKRPETVVPRHAGERTVAALLR